jgi:hypothetical protein
MDLPNKPYVPTCFYIIVPPRHRSFFVDEILRTLGNCWFKSVLSRNFKIGLAALARTIGSLGAWESISISWIFIGNGMVNLTKKKKLSLLFWFKKEKKNEGGIIRRLSENWSYAWHMTTFSFKETADSNRRSLNATK